MEEVTKDVELNKEVKTEETKESKTYTEEDFKKALQAESDKRVSGALKTAQEKWEAEFKEKLEVEKSEAEKLGSMTESERLQSQFDKQKQDFETERQTFLRERMELQTVKELSTEGLPTDFSKYVIADTAEEVKANISTFKAQWQQAIESAVNDRLKGKTPTNSIGIKTAITKDEFNKMGYKERANLIESDPELYAELRK